MATGVNRCEGPFYPKCVAAMREKETSRGSSSGVPRADITDDSDPTEVAQKPSNKWAGLQHNAVAWLAFGIGAFCCNFSPLVPFDYPPFKANEAGMDLRLSQYTLYIFNAGSMVCHLAPGFLSDHLGQSNVMALVGVLSAISQLAIWLPDYYYPTNSGNHILRGLFGLFLRWLHQYAVSVCCILG